MLAALALLHTEIDGRVDRIRESQPDWLCGKGCDQCCRRLAEIPQLSAAEWEWLRQGLAGLSPELLQQIRHAVAALARETSRPLTCPLLDQASGACHVYAQRPVACRTYGFYAQRDKGLYCGEIETQVVDDVLTEVVWGNHDAVDQQLVKLGESRPLNDWFTTWQAL